MCHHSSSQACTELTEIVKACLIDILGMAEHKEMDLFSKSNIKISPMTSRHLYKRSRTTINFYAGNATKSNIEEVKAKRTSSNIFKQDPSPAIYIQ